MLVANYQNFGDILFDPVETLWDVKPFAILLIQMCFRSDILLLHVTKII